MRTLWARHLFKYFDSPNINAAKTTISGETRRAGMGETGLHAQEKRCDKDSEVVGEVLSVDRAALNIRSGRPCL